MLIDKNEVEMVAQALGSLSDIYTADMSMLDRLTVRDLIGLLCEDTVCDGTCIFDVDERFHTLVNKLTQSIQNGDYMLTKIIARKLKEHIEENYDNE